jgi:hypothetical protein
MNYMPTPIATTRKAEQARDLYTSGMTLRQVATAIGVSSITTVRAYLDQTGTPRRGPGPQTDKSRNRVCAAAGCDNAFNPTRQQVNRGHGRFCSRSCANTIRRIHPKLAERECARCGQMFTPMAGAPGKYCSRSCRSRAPRGDYAKVRSQWKTLCCKICGTERRVPPYSEMRFCSKSCFNKYRWRVGHGISDDSAVLKDNGRLKQKFKGRWAGPKGAADGAAKGGRPSESSSAQQVQMFEMYNDGASYREIAEKVLGDARLKDRVYRFVHR